MVLALKLGINRNILECKDLSEERKQAEDDRINRNILECKGVIPCN